MVGGAILLSGGGDADAPLGDGAEGRDGGLEERHN
jgi:hypothetical protein